VGAGGTATQRDIQPVIDDDRHPNHRHQPPQYGQQLARARVLEPKLDRSHPAPLSRLAHGHRVAPAQQAVVGHQHETQEIG
jgi:hypothetical protein